MDNGGDRVTERSELGEAHVLSLCFGRKIGGEDLTLSGNVQLVGALVGEELVELRERRVDVCSDLGVQPASRCTRTPPVVCAKLDASRCAAGCDVGGSQRGG